MPWDLLPVEQTRWYKKPLIWVGVAAVFCVLLLLLPKVQKRYQRWSERRGVQRAAEAYLRGDFKQALVDARGVLRKNPQSSEATRIVARSLEAIDSPQALTWRRELDSLQTGDVENLLALADASMKAADFGSAERALKKIRPEDQKTARFHLLAAKLAQRNQDLAAAETHWQEAVRLEPGNAAGQLGLAGVQLDSRVPAVREAAIATLEKLAEDPEQRTAALRLLVADATVRKERSRMRELAARLADDAGASFTDKLSRLAILRRAKDPQHRAYLAELQELAAPNAEDVYRLISWMNENDLALAVIDWEQRLAPEVAGRPPVCAAVADAYARAADWERLKAKIETAPWPDTEFLRLAFLARALERLDDHTAADAAWNNAVADAQTRPERLEMLAKVTRTWGWKQRTEETLWKLAAANRHPRWGLDFLWSAALSRQDTVKLYEVSKLQVQADPGNLPARNNHVSLALLTDQTADRPHELAEKLYAQNSGELIVATTYGYSLFRQGRASEAAAIMEEFSVDQLRTPVAAFYYAIFLAAAGQVERADEYFKLGEKAPKLPEEKALVAVLAPACRARVLSLGAEAAGSIAAWAEASAAAEARPEWLEMLGKMALDWQWESQAEAVVLRLAALERVPPWAGPTLWKAALKTQDAAQIHRAGRLLTKADAADLSTRARFLGVALLTGREAEIAQQQIAALARANPTNPAITATYAFSLYQQGRADEALALTGKLSPAEWQSPAVALYHGLFLAAANRKDEAAPFLQLAASAPLLAEEKALIAKAGEPPKASKPVTIAATPTPLPVVAKPIDRSRRDTAQLFKEAREAYLADSKNLLARGNYILLALLTGQSTDSARQLARALYREQPGDATVAAAYGLSLFQQGKVAEALAVMEALAPGQLREPVTAFYYGHFLAGSEAPGRAREFLGLAAQAALLPEERALLAADRRKGATIFVEAP